MSDLHAWEYWYPRKEGKVEPEIPKLAEIFKKNRFSRILDFGCGTGRHANYFARMGFQVHGFDLSVIAIQTARKHASKENLQIDLRVLNMNRPLPYDDAFFDAIISTRVLHHNLFRDITRIFHEIDRLLKKHGFLFLQVAAYSRRNSPESIGSTREFEEPEERTYIPLGGEEKGIPHHEFTRKELLELLPNYTLEKIHRATDHYSGYCLIVRKDKES